MKRMSIVFGLLAVICIIGIVFFLLGAGVKTANNEAVSYQITGTVEVKQVDVNVKVPGRVSQILVNEGDTITAGDEIAIIEADNIEAKAQLALAAIEAAKAQYQKAKNGARPQQRDQADNLVEQAKAGYELAETTYKRMEYLYQEGVLPQQKLDMARTEMEVAKKKYENALKQADLVREGAQNEDIAAAAALVKQAEAAYAEVQTYLKDARVTAPLSGIITAKNVESGELVSTGMPLVSISDFSDAWVEIKVRETALNRFKLGDTVPVEILAYPGVRYQGKVVYIAAKPSYATERAYQEKAEKDIVAFAVRIKLDNHDLKLRPGMTAVVNLQ
ncbi:MAG TPA: efflux RND transporter periplasmic adaptor subunit [Bacillota bacterium]|nr:efflux RND transporter periplasmic adaptor subunit [Bacillota bacterium]HPT87841.1 efflux RND transporter periplasmic adaptor subunit [Bacillota bacterium]